MNTNISGLSIVCLDHQHYSSVTPARFPRTNSLNFNKVQKLKCWQSSSFTQQYLNLVQIQQHEDGVFALPAVPSCGGRPLAALSSARPKKASPLSQDFGPTQAASSSSTSSSSSVSSRRIAVPRPRRRGGKENEM
ncbi:hypothetical protein [Parasitella parasitica]|uniref:Uncharacterized protein n=1 Tax=Parasitella parasitica TaxID=35722 RepID=A0A0B7N589_9FUNG|nr:hypothetical protein [Parasitella parasitica]